MSIRLLVVGLGNHVMLKTRHSVGMILCDSLASKYAASWSYERKFKGYTATIDVNGYNVLLMKSKLPMNINGKSVIKAVKEYGLNSKNLVVLHDDMERSLGKLSWKFDGSAGGHNGVKSVIVNLKTDKFMRLRFGIGRPASRDNVVDYVLTNFTEDEKVILERTLPTCVESISEKLVAMLPKETRVDSEMLEIENSSRENDT